MEKTADSKPLSITVNFSGKQLSRPEVVDQIRRIINNNHINPSDLSLEITESLLIECDNRFHNVLENIRNLGVNIHVDDFGRGYSSFSYLQQFPVNTLKIDALFTHLLGRDEKKSEIVNTIVNLAKSLGMSVVAEGVETDVQLQKLKEIQCTHVQGYFLSRPLTKEAAGDLLLTGRQIYKPD
jgi:EAL domain-containing protein (putative c-di-GMP-specific phosphodiesterase class I)